MWRVIWSDSGSEMHGSRHRSSPKGVCFFSSRKRATFAPFGPRPTCWLAALISPLPPDPLSIIPWLDPPIFQVLTFLCPCSPDSNLLLLCSSPLPETGEPEVTPVGHSLGSNLHLPSRAGLNHSTHNPRAPLGKVSWNNQNPGSQKWARLKLKY